VLLLLPLQQGQKVAVSNDKRTSLRARPSSVKGDVKADSTTPQLIARPFLTHYRGAMMIVTILAILAVDFPIFPRRFAKVETWGTSLMDLGVGSFVFSAGVVSARALFKTQQSGKMPSLPARVVAATKHSVPLLVLGVIRLISVKGLDYAEHVTEYGVHWNFFFTLALLPPFVELADTFAKGLFSRYATSCNALALLIVVAYELVLNNTDLLSYILISSRGPDLLSKNREGVFSFIGYLAIFLAGRGTGSTVVRFGGGDITQPANKAQNDAVLATARDRQQVLLTLITEAAATALLYWLSTSIYSLNLTVSRRLANLPYVLWIATFNNAQLALFGLAEAYGPPFSYNEHNTADLDAASSKIMQVFNKNGLVIFLIANLMTGSVNMSVNTLDMSDFGAMVILLGYATVVTAVALGMDYAGLRIRV
jgi:glucosaminylphosphatidylinositol acyltransferase